MGWKRQRYSIWYRYIHRQINICILYCIYCRYLGMASVQNRWRLEINTYLIKLQIIFNFYICWLSYSATGCRQITYRLPHECSQALASSASHPSCSSANLQQERVICELQSIQDVVALHMTALVAGVQLVRVIYNGQNSISETCVKL